jgi:hypothetical protein
MVRDFLRDKDEDYSQFIPESYKMSSEEKSRYTFLMVLRAKH